MKVCSILLIGFIFSFLISTPVWARPDLSLVKPVRIFTLDNLDNVVYKNGEVLGDSVQLGAESVPGQTFVFSADKYQLENDNGQIKVSTFQFKEATNTAQKFEFMKGNEKYEISTEGEGFTLIDKGDVTVRTNFPLAVKKSSRSLWLVTPTGEKEIKFTPGQVVESLVKNKILTKIELSRKEVTFSQGSESVGVKQNYLQIMDSPSGAYYNVGGEKEVKFLYFLPLSFSVGARVDVSNGRVLEINQPWFLDKLGFLFSN